MELASPTPYEEFIPCLAISQLEKFLIHVNFPVDKIISADRKSIVDGAASFSTLESLQARVVQTIPFDNLDVTLGRKIDPLKAFEKVVTYKRGGYCFETNTLMLQVLKTIGYSVRAAPGRVILSGPRAKTHLVSVVSFDDENEGPNSYIVDVAFGGCTPRKPLDISVVDAPIEAHPEIFRFIRDDKAQYLAPGALILQFFDSKASLFKNAYVVHPNQVVLPSDVEALNYYTSNYIGGNWFTEQRIIVKHFPDGKTFLNNNFLVTQRRRFKLSCSPVASIDETLIPVSNNWITDKKEIVDDDEYFTELSTVFDTDLSWNQETGKVESVSMESFTEEVLNNKFKS